MADHNPGPSRRLSTDRNIFSCFDDDSGDEDFNLPDIDQEIDSSDDESSDSDGEEETTDDRGWTEIQMPEPDVDNDIGVILRHSSEVTNIPGHVEEPVDYFLSVF